MSKAFSCSVCSRQFGSNPMRNFKSTLLSWCFFGGSFFEHSKLLYCSDGGPTR